MVNFITLRTNSHERRKVSVSYTDKRPKVCHLLGNLPHQTEFRRDELVAFAKNVLEVFDRKVASDR